jgi:ActR/RegA family two-component response regulator
MRSRGWPTHPDDWQLLIVDLFLKEGSGLGVLAGCKTRSAGQRVVVLSNYVTVDIRARCEALGADAVFDKSRDLDAFIEYCNTDRPSGLAAL